MGNLVDHRGMPLKCYECEDVKKCGNLCRVYDDCAKKLRDFEVAEEEGMLCKLPCKLGETVYDISEDSIICRIVRGFVYKEDGMYAIDGNGSNIGMIDKNLFLSRLRAQEILDHRNRIRFEESKMFVRLPCRVGDTVYILVSDESGDVDVRSMIVNSINITLCIEDGDHVYYEINGKKFAQDCLGNSLFLTEATARKRLKEILKNC